MSDNSAVVNTIQAFALWEDEKSCLATLPTTAQELLARYPAPHCRVAAIRARKNGKSQSELEFERSVKLLVETLRPYPPKPLPGASEYIQQIYTTTYNTICKQRIKIRRKMESTQQQEEDDDYNENDQNGQLDPNHVLAFYERHFQLQNQRDEVHARERLERDEQNSQFLLQLIGSPILRRPPPHSAAFAPNVTPLGTGIRRRPRRVETTPTRRVRRRTMSQNSPSAQVSTTPSISLSQVSTPPKHL